MKSKPRIQRHHKGDYLNSGFQRVGQFIAQRRYGSAEKILKKLRREFSSHADVFRISGLNALHNKKSSDAIKFVKTAILLSPESIELTDLLGTALMENGQFAAAESVYRKVLLDHPQKPGPLNNLGNALRQNGKLSEAVSCYEKSLEFRPGHESTLLNLADVLHQLTNFTQAEEVYKNILSQGTAEPSVYVNLSSTLLSQRKYEEALRCCEDGIAKLGDHSLLYYNRAYILGAAGKLLESEECLNALLAIDPNHARARQDISIHHFLNSRWQLGWEAYEARWLVGDLQRRPFMQETWNGEKLKGKRILIWGEQGAGDEIMFVSMLPDLLKEDCEILFETDPRLIPLFERSLPAIKWLAKSDPPSKEALSKSIDFQCSSGSIGRFLRGSEAKFSGGAAYLKAERNACDKIRKRYRQNDEKLVGIAWESKSPQSGEDKSMRLVQLKPLFQIEGIRFIDLQYGDTLEERMTFTNEMGVDLYHDDSIDQLLSLDDFSAQVASLDLVISVSNTTVHMAGALGVPVWVMLRSIPDRRWMLDREDSPWYSSVRLFRQKKMGDWRSVIDKVTSDLKKFEKTSN